MNFQSGLVLLAVVAVAWLVIRHFVRKTSRRHEAQRKRLDRRPADGPLKRVLDSHSARSEMRATDAPVSIIDSISHGGSNRRSSSGARAKRRRRRR
jgi:flagellar biosynthesis/type III secretory pathway M-ring protein FliF/YscJ